MNWALFNLLECVFIYLPDLQLCILSLSLVLFHNSCSFTVCVLVFPQLCVLSTVPLWSETSELSLWSKGAIWGANDSNSGKSD